MLDGVHFVVLCSRKVLLNLVQLPIDASVSNPVKCKMEERLNIAIVTSEIFVVNVC